MKKLIGIVATLFLVSVASVALAVTLYDQYEPDNSRSNAYNIALGTTQNHTIYPVGDVDWVKVTLPATGTYKIRIYNDNDGVPLKVSQYLKVGMLPEISYGSFKITYRGYNTITVTSTETVRVNYAKIGVSAFNSGTTGQYRIQVWKP